MHRAGVQRRTSGMSSLKARKGFSSVASAKTDATGIPAVLMVTGAYFPELSGGGLQARGVVRALAGRARFTVLTTSIEPSLPARTTEDGVPIYRIVVDPRSPLSRIRATAQFAAALYSLRRDVDIVNLHGFSKKAVLIALFCRLFRKPYVLTLQTGGDDEPAGARMQGRLAAWAYGAADRYLSVSPGLSAAYRAAALPADRLRQVCNAVDVDRFRPARASERNDLRDRLGLPRDRCLVLFVGFFGRDKRPDWLFGAWAALPAPARSRSGLVFLGRTDSAHAEVDGSLASGIRPRAAQEGAGGSLWFGGARADCLEVLHQRDSAALAGGIPRARGARVTPAVKPSRTAGATRRIVLINMAILLVLMMAIEAVARIAIYTARDSATAGLQE